MTSPADRPRISVIMTVFNGADHVADAVGSVLRQTLTDFELVVVDDGSTDGTAEVLRGFTDPRLHVILRPHTGRVPALNHALAVCRAPYVANLDADDVADDARLERTVAYLDANPEVVAVGSAVEPYLAPTERSPRRLPRTDRAIRWAFLLRNPLFNSSVAYRRDALIAIGGFSMDYADRLHDADALLRIAKHGRLANIDAPLSYRRLHAQQHFAGVAKSRRASLHARMRWRAARVLDFPLLLQPVAYAVAAGAAARSLVVLGVLGRNGRVDRQQLFSAEAMTP